ncbi:MAG: hypothetical protein RLZZ175_2448 [Bacteroidota bacterium]|jgi:uncharacterized protein YfaS (alpha-2-macroglobulin family)
MKIYLKFSLITFLILFINNVFAQTKPSTTKPVEKFSYDKTWEKVYDFANKQLPKSALVEVNKIYKQAKKENCTDHLVKAIIYQMKYNDYQNENGFVANIEKLKAEIKTAQFPAKPLLHSMLAEMYWQYYENNRWGFSERTETINYDNKNIATWSINQIVKETIKEYQNSLLDKEKLKTLKTETYKQVLDKGNSIGDKLRPTIYDFLAHRAIDFFLNEEPNITRPAYFFSLDKEEYFADANNFVNLNITSKDSLSLKFQALKYLQEITKFHLNDENPDALVEIELKRLRFVAQNHTSANKNDLLLKALQNLEQKVIQYEISTVVSYEIAKLYNELGNQYKPLENENHKWDKKTAYDLCEKAKSRFPNSRGAQDCASLQNDIAQKSISAVTEEVNAPNLPFKALLSYKNVNKIYYRIIKTNKAEIKEQPNEWERNYDKNKHVKFLSYYISKTFEKSGSYTLPIDGDFQPHSSEIKLDDLPVGAYMILLSNNENFSTENNALTYAFTRVSNISYVHRNTKNGTTDFYILNRTNGAPIVGAEVTTFISSYDKSIIPSKGISLVTDKNGFVNIPSQNRANFYINISLGDDFNSTLQLDNYYNESFYQYKNTEPVKSQKVLFFMDRAIYRPGQTIQFTGLAISTDGKASEIIPNYKTTILLNDVNGEKVSSIDVVTNEFGTFKGSFTAPSEGLLGNMELESSEDESIISFSVEEYKRPKFEVKFEQIKGSFKLNENVNATLFAKSYSGTPIDGAKVQYRIVREVRFPFWGYYKRVNFENSSSVEILNGNAQTDELGKYKINFIALADPTITHESDPTFTYTIYADVTDINGETHSTSSTISVAYKALEISTNITDLDKQNLDSWNKEYKINTQNLAGEFEPAKGKISIYSLKQPTKAYRNRYWPQADKQIFTKEEYAQLFPFDEYADESNFYTWEKNIEVLKQDFDTELKQAFSLASLKNAPSGKYLVELISKDKFGQEVKSISYFTIYSLTEKQLSSPENQYINVLTNTVEPGQNAKILIGTSATKTKVLYEIELDNKIIASEWIELKNEQKTIEIPIFENYRGNIGVHFTFVLNNRLYTKTATIQVPFSNKELDIAFETFRDKLQPGEKEEWKIKISGKNITQLVSEMVATLYDASLDAFRVNEWNADFWANNNISLGWSSQNGFGQKYFSNYSNNWNLDYKVDLNIYPQFYQLNWFNCFYYSHRVYEDTDEEPQYEVRSAASGGAIHTGGGGGLAAPIASAKYKETVSGIKGITYQWAQNNNKLQPKTEPAPQDFSTVKARTNFNETAFFYPQLLTNEKGELSISFTIPEALTRWKMLGFAHTKVLKSGFVSKELVTQKELMVVPNQPRFFRENDKMAFSVKISSLSDKELNGQAQLEFFDALTMQPINEKLKITNAIQNFTAKAGQSIQLEWNIEIPTGLQAVMYKVVAKSGNFSDGEEMILPVVTNSMLVTESLPLPIRGNESKNFTFDKLVNNTSTTLRNHKFTLEFTSNPAWYAIQALPYLMEYPYECVEQTFSRFYANSIASNIANSNPRIKQVFDTWSTIQPDALLSNLEKNQELKSALLEETPWVLQAKDESQRKRAVALLFDLNKMSQEKDKAFEKIQKAQSPNGGFSWFAGMPEDRYMTQHIIAGMGHLDVLGVESVRTNEANWTMVKNAIKYIDQEMYNDYKELLASEKKGHLKLKDNHLSYINIHYLYLRSYFKDIPVNKNHKVAFDYFLKQGTTYWTQNSIYMQAMLCLALHRNGVATIPAIIIKSFKEKAIYSEEMGMYWKQDRGLYWYQAPIETQALLIEVFDEVAKDQKSVENLKVWLLKQKQTQDWKTTRATAEACYALLRRGANVLESNQLVEIKLGNQTIDPSNLPDTKVEAGTGYFKTSFTGSAITPEMGKITVTKKDEGVAWGAAYWQYFEQLDKITPAETPLKINKKLFLQVNTDKGLVITPIDTNTSLQVGDVVKVRIEINVDRAMEYVHLKDMRASAFEPLATLSTYRFQDGLYYYESPKDLSMNFFIGYLPKGTYVFEYPLRVSQKGNFSNGITIMQSMYAPEFTTHSEGVRVNVEK